MELELPFLPNDKPFFLVVAAVATFFSLLLALVTVRSKTPGKSSAELSERSDSLAPPALSCSSAEPLANGVAESAAVSAGEGNAGVSMMEQLVPEITTHALSYLDYPSLCRLSMTNSLMRKAANDDNAWKALYHKDFTLEQDTVTPVNGWKAYYAATRAIVNVNRKFFNIIRDRSFESMAQFWLNADYVKCIHASGELFSGYDSVMQSWQVVLSWDQGFDFQVRDVRARVLSDMAWVTLKTPLDVDGEPFHITNVFERHGGRWYMVHHHCSEMLVHGMEQQVIH